MVCLALHMHMQGEWHWHVVPVPVFGRMRLYQPVADNFPTNWLLRTYRETQHKLLTVRGDGRGIAIHRRPGTGGADGRGIGIPPRPEDAGHDGRGNGIPPRPVDGRTLECTVQIAANIESRAGSCNIIGYSFKFDGILRAVKASMHIKKVSDLGECAKDFLSHCLLGDGEKVAEMMDQVGFKHPKKTTLVKARVRLDLACMLCYRETTVVRDAPRCIGFDKSPQIGREIMAVREEIKLERGLRRPSGVQARTLPVCCMGYGFLEAQDIAQSVLHAALLEYGPTYEKVKRWCRSVRGVLTDDGTEKLIADAQCCLHALFGLPNETETFQFLFPFAMRLPGANHILDVCLRKVLEKCEWYHQFEATLKTMSKVLSINTYTDVLKEACLLKGDETESKIFETSPTAFIKWRWGTLVNCLKDIMKRRAPLLNNFQADMFKGNNEMLEVLKQVCSLEGHSFWVRVFFVEAWLEPLEEFRSWCMGCQCHEAELLLGKKVECCWKGKRLPELRKKVKEFSEKLVRRANSVLKWEWAKDDRHRQEEFVALTNALNGMVQLKFAFLSELPYAIVEARDRRVMQELVEKYEQGIADGVQHHRVTKLFFDREHPERLRECVDSFIGNGRMPQKLDEWLASYEWLPVDESQIEGVHRGVSRECARSPAGRHPWNAATQRLGQNVKFIESALETISPPRVPGPPTLPCPTMTVSKEFFSWAWNHYKLLLVKREAKRGRTPKEMVHVPFQKMVTDTYRLDRHCYMDWSHWKVCFGKAALQAPAATEKQLCLKDYIQHVVKPFGYYSVPDCKVLADDAESVAEAPPRTPANAVFREERVARKYKERFVFQVLDINPGRHSLVKAVGNSRGAFNVQLQWYQVWLGQERHDRLEAFVDSDPEVVDLVELTNTECWRDGLRAWTCRGMADVAGCIELIGGETMAWSGDEESLPVIAKMERLTQAGWTFNRSPDMPHDQNESAITNTQVCLSAGVMSRPTYLSCLLKLPSLYGKGLVELHCGQHDMYYQAALQLSKPNIHHLEPDKLVGFYKQLISLNEKGEIDELAITGPSTKVRRRREAEGADNIAALEDAPGAEAIGNIDDVSASEVL